MTEFVIAVIFKSLIAFVVPLLVVPPLIWGERRILGRIQSRVGPNRVGPFGVFQTLADAVKLLGKEDMIPAGADRTLFILAPVSAIGAVIYGVVCGADWDRTPHIRTGDRPLCYRS